MKGVALFSNGVDAQFFISVLKSNGIEARLNNEQMLNIYPAALGALAFEVVVVNAEDEEKALSLYEDYKKSLAKD